MKTRLKLNWLIVMVIALTGLLPSARAFYAPTAQRWLNRDPLGELGFERIRVELQPDSSFRWDEKTYFGWSGAGFAELREGANLYSFVENDPLIRNDPFGLLWHNGKFPPWMLNPVPNPLDAVPQCVKDCAKTCFLVHLPARAVCLIGCIGVGPGYIACVGTCNGALYISQAVCTAACIAGSK